MAFNLRVNSSQTLRLLSKGLFAVDKTKNCTSAEVLERVKQVLYDGVKPKYRPDPFRVGHGGTLDSTATGVLVVGVGLGCKMLPAFLHGTKHYRVIGQLGIATDTYNENGNIVAEVPYDHVTEEFLRNTLEQFQGKIMQTPPKYSALKQGGKRLSDLMRDGIDVNPQPRLVMCHEIEVEGFSSPHFTLSVTCGGGFYIRSLVHDLGLALNTCAHVCDLKRMRQGPFTASDMLAEEDWTVTKILKAIIGSRTKHSKYFNV